MAWNIPPDQDAMGGVFGAQNAPLWLQSGAQQAPPNGPAQRLLNPFNPPRARGIGESIANALLPRSNEQGEPQAPGVGDFINAAMWVLPGGPRGGTIRPSAYGASNLSAANRNSLRPERPAVATPQRNPNIEMVERNPYAVSMRDIEGARGNSEALRHLDMAVDNWASQSGREATLPVRAALNKEIERAQAMELAEIEKQMNIDQSKIVPFPER